MDCRQYPRTTTTDLLPAVRVRLIALIEADSQPIGAGQEQHGHEALDTLASQLEPLLRVWSRENRQGDAFEGRTALAILHWPSNPPEETWDEAGPAWIPFPARGAQELVHPYLGSLSATVEAAPDSGTPAAAAAAMLVEPLSARELEVLRLVAAGLSNRKIAAELFLSVGTVKQHLHHINGKLGTTSRTGAIARGRHCGLL